MIMSSNKSLLNEGPVSIQLQIQSDKSRSMTSHPLKIQQRHTKRQSELQFIHIANSISNQIYTFFTFITDTPFGRKDQIRANRERPYRGILWPYRYKTPGTGTRPAQLHETYYNRTVPRKGLFSMADRGE